jgi:hypothetical protein
MRFRHSPLLLALGVVATTAMASQQAGDPRLDARLVGRTKDSVNAIVESARRAGLPTEPLVQRALEGVQKNISGEVVLQSVGRLSQLLQQAKSALGPASSREDVEAGAQALKNGVDVKKLERLGTMRVGQRVATAINVVNFIKIKGVQVDTAADVIGNLVAMSASDEQLLALQDEITRAIAGGTPAASATLALGQGLQTAMAAQANGGAPGSPLPSPLGSTRSTGPAANGPLGGANAGGAASQGTRGGGSKPGPAGLPKKP